MIAVDVEGKIIGNEPPKLEIQQINDFPPANRPKIKANVIPPKHVNTAEENREEFLNMYMAPYRAFKKLVKAPYNLWNKGVKTVGKTIFPTAGNEPTEDVPGYPFEVTKELKDNWITYKDIQPFEQPDGFTNELKLKKMHQDYADKNAGAHAYNVWKNTEDYYNRQISDPKRSTIKKIADVPRYFFSKAAGMGAKYWADWEDVKKDPVGTVWNDPELSQAAKSVVKSSVSAVADYMYPTGHHPLTNAKNAMMKDQGHAFIDLLTDTDAKKSLSKALNSTLDHNRLKEHWNTVGQANHNRIEKKYEKLYRFAEAINLAGPQRMNAQKRREKQMFDNVQKDDIREQLENRINNDLNNKQAALFAVGGGGGGGFGGYSGWKYGRRRTYFKKYHRQFRRKARKYWRRNMGYLRPKYYYK